MSLVLEGTLWSSISLWCYYMPPETTEKSYQSKQPVIAVVTTDSYVKGPPLEY